MLWVESILTVFTNSHSLEISNIPFEALPTGFLAHIIYIPHQAKVELALAIVC